MKTATKSPKAKSPVGAKSSVIRPAAAVLPRWKLLLYIAGKTTKSFDAFENLKQLCDEYLAGRYDIEVVDLIKNPKLAQGDQILAVPTVVRKLPAPIRKIIGTLADAERVLVGLDLRPHRVEPPKLEEGTSHAS
jgi:circadian clock protein KaiB